MLSLQKYYIKLANNVNHSFPPLFFSGEELNQIYILGKAVAFQSDVK
jgi:hypothetical protein|nr:MAG TPA: hypothetical protein [Caudoviricetes sp.]